MISIRKCVYCGEEYDSEVGDRELYCETCRELIDFIVPDEDSNITGDNNSEIASTEAVGSGSADEDIDEIDLESIPESVYDIAESISIPQAIIKKQKELEAIDDFGGCLKPARMKA